MTSSLFVFDWDSDGPTKGVASPELAATLARLEIGIADHLATIAQDQGNASVHRSINVSLYPLAEWIVFNWWQLLYGGRVDMSVTDGSLAGAAGRRARVHNVRSAGDGFIWPDLSIAAEGGMVRLEWHADRTVPAGRDIRYVSSGVEWATLDRVVQSFSGLVESVLQRLDDAGLGETPLHKEWKALRELDAEQAEFCQACGRLGLDPFSDGVDLADSIEGAFARLDRSVIWDFYDAANPRRLDEEAAWVRQADQLSRELSERTSRNIDIARLRTEARAIECDDDPRPWEVGYAQARALRRAVGLTPSEPVTDSTLPVELGELESNEPALLGFTRSGSSTGLVLGWHASDVARRFAAARALWHAACATDEHPSLLTSGSSRDQQTARAFAAEFLAPAEGIKEALGGVGAIAAAPMVADRFMVSETVIERQIENQLGLVGGSVRI